jgi:hypothetical protein
MIIHTIGDSHSYYGWSDRNIENFVIHNDEYTLVNHHLGPMTCYAFGKRRCDIKKYNIQDGDAVIFCLGEIDCRCHIHKYVTETNTHEEVIEQLCHNYFKQIKFQISQLDSCVCVAIYNIVPPFKTSNAAPLHTAYPLAGNSEQRKKYALYFNKILKKKCEYYNYYFFDIYNKYADEYMFLKSDLSDGYVHITVCAHIINCLLNFIRVIAFRAGTINLCTNHIHEN